MTTANYSVTEQTDYARNAEILADSIFNSKDIPSFDASTITSTIDRAIQSLDKSRPEVRRCSLFLWTLKHRLLAGENLNVFTESARKYAPDRLVEATNILRGMDIPRSTEELTDDQYQATLLDQINLTVARAHHVAPRYRNAHFAQYVPDLESYRRLPTLDRAEVEKSMPAICASDVSADFFTATSATSTGRSLLVPHVYAENQNLRRFSAGPDAANAQKNNQGMTLRLMPAARMISPTAGRGNTILATYDTNAIRENIWDSWDYLIGQVFAEFPTPDGMRPVSQIHVTPAFGFILLTKYMLQRGVPPTDSAVKSIWITGSWIGPTTRKWLEDAWETKINTTYSCSELVGASIACPVHAGRYHYLPNVYPEILNDKNEHVAEGECGAIHLSGMYPFHQAAVFLRYSIGDYGRWRGFEQCECGEVKPSLDLLGRNRDVLRFRGKSGEEQKIAPIPTRNALDRFTCVPKIPRPQYRFSVTQDTTPKLNVDVECFAMAGPHWRQRIRDDIASAIIEEDETIAGLLNAGEIDMEVRLHTRSRLTQSTSTI